MGAIRKYFLPLFRVGFWALFHYGKMKRYGKHKEKYSFEERYAFATLIFKKVAKAFRVTLRVNGLEKIEDKRTLIVANHQSFYDPFITDILDFPVGWVAKKEIAKFPFVGWVAKSIDVIFMDREDLRSSINVISEASEYLKNGKAMWINPEGTRSKNEGHAMNDFKAGTFKTAFKSEATITMVALNGTWKVFDKHYHKKIYIDIDVIGQIKYEEYKDMTTQEIAQYTHDKINEKFLELKEKDA